MERSRKSLRTSSADFRPVTEEVSGIVGVVVTEEVVSEDDVVEDVAVAPSPAAREDWVWRL